jgi:iron complex transport system permease protein
LFAGAFIGAAIIIAVILFLSSILKNKVFLLIVGVAVGYLASSLISVLNYFATSEGVHSYLIWGMGSFSAVSLEQLPLYAVLTLILLVVSLFMMKPLNALLLGDAYAHNLGVNVKSVRGVLLAVTGLLTAVVTAFCGPISFLGLAVPHIARLIFGTNNHRVLLPATLMCGALAALLCNIVCLLPGESGILPLGAITPLIGAPVIIYVVLNSKNL